MKGLIMQKITLMVIYCGVLANNTLFSMENEAKRVCKRNTQVDLTARQAAELQKQQLLTNNLFEISGSSQDLAVIFLNDYIRQGANPNCCDETGLSPLHKAARAGNLATMRLLIEANANPNKITNDRITPLHSAVLSNQPQIRSTLIKYLIASGAQKWQTPEYSPLRLAVERGDYLACAIILSSLSMPIVGSVEEKVNQELNKLKIELKLPDENGQTLQQLALSRNFNDIAQLVDPDNIAQFKDALLESGREHQ